MTYFERICQHERQFENDGTQFIILKYMLPLSLWVKTLGNVDTLGSVD